MFPARLVASQLCKTFILFTKTNSCQARFLHLCPKDCFVCTVPILFWTKWRCCFSQEILTLRQSSKVRAIKLQVDKICWWPKFLTNRAAWKEDQICGSVRLVKDPLSSCVYRGVIEVFLFLASLLPHTCSVSCDESSFLSSTGSFLWRKKGCLRLFTCGRWWKVWALVFTCCIDCMPHEASVKRLGLSWLKVKSCTWDVSVICPSLADRMKMSEAGS